MSDNETKLTDEQFSTAIGFYSGIKSYQIRKDITKIINFAYNCAIENEKLKNQDIDDFKIYNPETGEEIVLDCIDIDQLDK